MPTHSALLPLHIDFSSEDEFDTLASDVEVMSTSEQLEWERVLAWQEVLRIRARRTEPGRINSRRVRTRT